MMEHDPDPDAHEIDHLQSGAATDRRSHQPPDDRWRTGSQALRQPFNGGGPAPDNPAPNAAPWMVHGNYAVILHRNPPRVPANGGNPLTAGRTFMCAAANVLLTEYGDLVRPYDNSPYGGLAGSTDALAVAWFGKLHSTLLDELGNGRSFTPDAFLLQNLATRDPDPVLFAACFAALTTAAIAASSGRPFRTGDRGAFPRPAGRGPTVHLSSDEKTTLKLQHLQALPAGMSTLGKYVEMTIDRVSAEPGEHILDKSLSYLRSCAGKLATVGSSENALITHEGVLTLGEKKLNATQHITFQQAALREAPYTLAAAGSMNLDDPKTCKLLQALTNRDFQNTATFGLSRFIPASFNPKREQASVFGEAENGILSGQPNTQFGLDARQAYWALEVALTVLLIADLPTLDIGFQTALQWFIYRSPFNQAMSVPFWWVAQVLGKTFQHSQSLRRMATGGGFGVEPVAKTMLYSYTDSHQILAEKAKIEAYDNNKMDLELWSMQARMHKDGTSDRGRQDKPANATRDGGKRGGSKTTKDTATKDRSAGSTRGGGKGASSATARDTSTAPAQKKVKFSSSSATATDRVRKLKFTAWNQKYGTRNVNGDEVKICFFEWNKEAGCTKSNCPMSHDHSPTDYNNKRFHALPVGAQNKIVTACE